MDTTTTLQPLSTPAQRGRRRRWLLGGIVTLLLIAVAFAALLLWRMNYLPADLDTATTRHSEQDFFRGAYTPKLAPLSINQIHAWTLHLEAADGQPLQAAQITVDGGMPQHGHGLPTSPQVTTNLGNGDYLVEGMKFQMPGWWVVNFHITTDGKTDTLTFNLILQ